MKYKKRKSIENGSLVLPNDILENFIKVDISDTDEITEFCQKYRKVIIVPHKIEKEFESFRKEYKQLQPIYQRAIQNKLLVKDLNLINKKLTNKNDLLRIISPKRVIEINNDISNINGDNELPLIQDGATYKFIRDYTYTDSYTELWNSLVDRLTQNTYRNCKYCGLFFEFVRDSKKFCSPDCKARYNYNKSHNKSTLINTQVNKK